MQLDSLAYGDVDIQSNPIPTDERGWHDVMAAVRPLSLSNCLLIPATTAQCRQPFGSCHQTQDPHGRRTLYIQTISNRAARSNKKKKKRFFFFFFHFFFLVVLLVKPHGVRPVLSQPNRHRHPLGWKNIQGVCLVRLSGAVLARLFTVCCNKFSVCIQRDSIDEKEEISRPAPFAKETKKEKKINI